MPNRETKQDRMNREAREKAQRERARIERERWGRRQPGPDEGSLLGDFAKKDTGEWADFQRGMRMGRLPQKSSEADWRSMPRLPRSAIGEVAEEVPRSNVGKPIDVPEGTFERQTQLEVDGKWLPITWDRDSGRRYVTQGNTRRYLEIK